MNILTIIKYRFSNVVNGVCRYGIGASSAGPAQTATIGSECTGVSTIPPSAPAMVGLGDYLDIAILQPGTGTTAATS